MALMHTLVLPQNQHTFNSHLNYLNLKTMWAQDWTWLPFKLLWEVVHMKQMLSRWGAWSWDIISALWPVNQEHCYLYEQDIYIWPAENWVKASIFTPPALSSGVWEEPPQSSIRDLLQCWMRRETAIQQMMGWICFHLSSAWACWSPVKTSKHEWCNFL